MSQALRTIAYEWQGPGSAPFVVLDYLEGPPVGVWPVRLYVDPGDPCGWAVIDSVGGVTFGECESYALLRWVHRDIECVVCERPPSALTIYRPEPHLVVGALGYVCMEQKILLTFQGREVRSVARTWLKLGRNRPALSPHGRDALLHLVWREVRSKG